MLHRWADAVLDPDDPDPLEEEWEDDLGIMDDEWDVGDEDLEDPDADFQELQAR